MVPGHSCRGSRGEPAARCNPGENPLGDIGVLDDEVGLGEAARDVALIE